MEKAIPKVDTTGLYLEDSIAMVFSSVTPLRNADGEEPYAYLVAVPIDEKFYRPRFDLKAWNAYQEALEKTWNDYDTALTAWYDLPENERGPKPELTAPEMPTKLWAEGLTQAEIDELLKQGEQPPSEIEELRQSILDLYETIAAGGQ